MDLQLKGKNALVTGGSKGIGRAIADLFAAEGANVAICARQAGEVDATTKALAQKGVKSFGKAVDVADATVLTQWVEAAAKELGGIDALVCNVSALAVGNTPETWEKSFRTDMMHTVNAVTAALPHLEASEAVQMITSGITAWRSTGSALWLPLCFSYLARAYAELGQFDDAWRCIGDAMTTVETTKEKWCEGDIHRIAGELAPMSPVPDAANAEAYFERALTVARQQQAKSWELRAAMSLARLWRDQGKVQQARELLAPVYGWFTEGFDTRDLKEAKALLEELQ